MAQRFLFLIKYYLVIIIIFLLQKPAFMLSNMSNDSNYSMCDYLSVMWHGLSLDMSITGYLIILPLLVILFSVWYGKKIELRKYSIYYIILITVIMSIIYVVDTSLYSFWQFKLDATVFIYIDSPTDAMASVSTGYILLRVLYMLIMTAILTLLLMHITPKVLNGINTLRNKVIATIILLIITVPLAISIRGGVSESTANVGTVYYSEDQFLNHSAVNPLFSMISSLSKSEDYSKEFAFFSEEERGKLFNGLYDVADENVPELLNTSTPNILMIVLEGFGTTVMQKPGVAPNLQQLSNEGVFFSQFYANSFRTDRGLVSILSGYLGQPTTSIMKMPAKCETLPSIASDLRNNGYATDFIYGGDINFTNMQGYLRATGYNKIIANTDFSVSERKTGAWGAADHVSSNRVYDEIKSRGGNGKWFTTYLTISSHDPYEVPYKKFKDPFLNAFAYTDSCVGTLIKRLRTLPQWQNMLVIILPDHGNRDVDWISATDPKFYHIPMIWVGGAVKYTAIVDKIMNQTDLPATLLAQLKIKKNPGYIFSRNVLSDNYVNQFAFSTYNNGIVMRDKSGTTVIDNESNKVLLNTDTVKSRTNKARAILQTLYNDLNKR